MQPWRTHTHTHTDTHTQRHAQTHTQTDRHTHTNTHTYTRVRAHTHAHTRTHTHTHTTVSHVLDHTMPYHHINIPLSGFCRERPSLLIVASHKCFSGAENTLALAIYFIRPGQIDSR